MSYRLCIYSPGIARRIANAIAALSIWPDALAGQGRVYTIPDQPACPRCSIEVQHTVSLDTKNDSVLLDGAPVVVRADGRGRYWVIAPGLPPMVFDPAGRFLRSIGAIGSGPQEFLMPGDIIPLAGDSVLVLDGGTQRASVVGPSFSFSRTIHLTETLPPATSLAWPHRVVMAGMITSADGIGWPLHFVDFSGLTAQVVRSFGSATGELRPGEEFQLRQQTALSRRQGFWAAPESQYRLTLWSQEGEAVQSFVRTPPWFSGKSSFGLGTPRSPPPPAIVGFTEDRGGLLWVFVRVPAPTWRDAWPEISGPEIPTKLIRYDRLFKTMVEVIDPVRRQVVATRLLENWTVTVLSGPRAVAYSTDLEGYPSISVLTLGLRGR